jgi:hypothetical protein
MRYGALMGAAGGGEQERAAHAGSLGSVEFPREWDVWAGTRPAVGQYLPSAPTQAYPCWHPGFSNSNCTLAVGHGNGWLFTHSSCTSKQSPSCSSPMLYS